MSAPEARDVLDLHSVKSAVRSAFAGLSAGTAVQPSQIIARFADNVGDCIFYPGALLDLDVIGVKLSPYIVQRTVAGSSPVTAYTLLLSASTGEPVLLVDSLALTSIRTAATTALAVDLLAARDASTLTVIGAGNAAIEHIRLVSHERDWRQVTVYSPSLVDNAREIHTARRSKLRHAVPDARIAPSARDAIEDADVVLLCTSSSQPVIELADVKSGALITSISTNSANAHEIAPSALTHLDVYCDYRATAPVTAGEMILAAEEGWSAADIAADLNELIGGYTPDRTRTRFFRSTGLGIEDLAIASLLRERR